MFMLNTLDDYICRSLSDSQPFTTNPNLTKKVDGQRQFREFIGNTVVFTLDDSQKCQIAALREELYAAAAFMLSARLDTSTFHMTLHDLVNGPAGDQEIRQRMEVIAPQAKDLICRFREDPPILMRGSWMFNMVNTSIVLGLKPVDADGEQRLGSMYQAFEKILPLGYALTPHITLAYFLPGTYTAQEAAKLSHALRPVDLDIELRMENLVLQNFLDMNHYETVF
jgi:hypothetical protein